MAQSQNYFLKYTVQRVIIIKLKTRLFTRDRFFIGVKILCLYEVQNSCPKQLIQPQLLSLYQSVNFRIFIPILLTYVCYLPLCTDGQTLPLNRRQKVFPNGTLIVEQTQRGEDAGTYTCQASNRQRHAARREVEVQILGESII